MLQRLASNPLSAAVDPADLLELEAGFAPMEAAFTRPSFLARLLRRLSAAEFTDLFANGGGTTLTAVLRQEEPPCVRYPACIAQDF